jgi:hypothetical protein
MDESVGKCALSSAPQRYAVFIQALGSGPEHSLTTPCAHTSQVGLLFNLDLNLARVPLPRQSFEW